MLVLFAVGVFRTDMVEANVLFPLYVLLLLDATVPVVLEEVLEDCWVVSVVGERVAVVVALDVTNPRPCAI